jgi:hypothetical protein
LTRRISVVGGGATGLGISHALDPNVYLLSGGAASLAERLGALVYLSELEREALENADEEALGLSIARRNGYGSFPLEGGQEHIDLAVEAFATMLPPRSILQ